MLSILMLLLFIVIGIYAAMICIQLVIAFLVIGGSVCGAIIEAGTNKLCSLFKRGN